MVHGVDAAVRAAGGAPEIMVIGGADLFRLFLPRAARIHLTRVHGDIAGDVMWPALDDTWAVGRDASRMPPTSAMPMP